VQLVWEDAVIFFLGVGPAWAMGVVDPMVMFAAGMVPYLVLQGIAAWVTGAWLCGSLTIGGLAAYLIAWRSPIGLAIVAAAIYLVVLVGIRQSLMRFPWELRWMRSVSVQSIQFSDTHSDLGWPFGALAPPGDDSITVSKRDRVLIAVLFGIWIFCLYRGIVAARDPGGTSLAVIGILGVFVCSSFRVLWYLIGYDSPLSFWGRLLRLRWIIPRYDILFLYPLLACLVYSAILGVSDWWLGAEPDACASVGLTSALLMLFLGGPSLRRWRLTGGHRIVSPKHTEWIQVG
jgi:hypothetical protein